VAGIDKTSGPEMCVKVTGTVGADDPLKYSSKKYWPGESLGTNVLMAAGSTIAENWYEESVEFMYAPPILARGAVGAVHWKDGPFGYVYV